MNKKLNQTVINMNESVYCTSRIAIWSKLILFLLQDNVDLGDLMFSLCYLPTAGRLTITMIKAQNLKAMDITGASGMSRFRFH